ncbi:MAG: iron-containing alcohol dehydrogenase [Actinobacteria bacterium]|nr:iron-containing alcohol dehydrogenase [Actinomycetota bacterium]
MIVRWGLDQLGGVLEDLSCNESLLVASERWRDVELPVTRRFHGVRSHAPIDSVEAARAAAGAADCLVGLGGGSAIDTAKAVSAETGLPVISVPTTYAGAEWTPFFGMRDEARGVKTGGGGARLAAIVYEPELTLELPRAESGGTALNALAHCAEALYVQSRNDGADRHALRGARLISEFLPTVLRDGRNLDARTRLLEGAAEAGAALGKSGLALGHAMAQALGGRYGLPHGALNAICLRAALRFNAEVAGPALQRFAEAMGADDAVARVEELAGLAGFHRLRDLGVPVNELDEVAEATATRAGAKANPRPANAAQIAKLLREVW